MQKQGPEQQTERRLGVHTSISGGIHLSLERAKALGCTTLQIFSHNPRQWHANTLHDEEVRHFRALREAYDINPVYIHSSYLINLCALDNEILGKSIRLLIKEIQLADALGADFVVLHTGSASKDTAENARKRAIDALRGALSDAPSATRVRLLLENTAGERGDISSRIADLATLIEGVESHLIGGICLDTCHAFQAGYNIDSPGGLSECAGEIERLIGITAVKLIHLNDSKRPFNTRVDRHEHIGSGALGKQGLERFVAHEAFREVPLILETPKESETDDARNLAVVREILASR